MKSDELSPAFDCFDGRPVMINTKIQAETKGGIGLVSYRGIIVDKDDFMVYLGLDLDDVTTAIKWDEISSIEIMNMEEETQLLNAKVESGSRN